MGSNRLITQCRICKSRNIVPFIEAPSMAFPGTMARYCACNDCNTVMDEGNSVVHYTEAWHSCSVEHALRHYLEIGAGIDFMVRVILAISSLEPERTEGERLRFLDIGCGFGFSCSLAQFRDWEPTGVEPTQIGVFGAKMLGVPILHSYLENTDLTPGHFDFVYSSEVIEHTQDVDGFVTTASRYLKPDGVLILTTPNGQVLRGLDAVESEWLESLYPGYHVNVFSPASLEMVLRRNGMSSVHIILSEGTSGRKRMIAFASRAAHLPSIPWKELDIKPFVRSYLKDLIAEREKAQECDALYCGALYRLIELLVNFGDYAEAEQVMAKLDDVLAREGKPPEKYGQLEAADLKEYLSQAPAFAGLYTYYKGLFNLNYRADYSSAEKWFRTGQHLCVLEGRVDPGGMYLRRHWPEKCRFHAGLALLYGGRQREALREFDALLAEPGKVSEDIKDQLLWSKAIAHLQLGDRFQAARYFADTWLQRRYADAPDQYLPLRHMTIALAQAGDKTATQLQAIEYRVTERRIEQGALASRLLDAGDQVCQRLDALSLRWDRLRERVLPFWRVARPFASRLLSLARATRSGYRWLRAAAQSAGKGVRAAAGFSTGDTLAPAAPHPETITTDQRDLLLVCPDHLGRIRIGIGMRHWEIARALAARGLHVTLASPHPFADDLRGDGFALLHMSSAETLLAHAAAHRCIAIQGAILEEFPSLRDSKLPIAVDLITPMHLENLEQTPEAFEHARRILINALERGDFFVCGNERQRLHWLGMLAGLGRLPFAARADHPELRRLIDLVPFGIPDMPPVKSRAVLKGVRPGISRDDFVLTWFGGIWDWLEPLPIVRAVGAAWQQDERIKLFFSAYRRPDGVVPNMARRVRELADELGLLDRCVFFNDYPVPFEERGDYLLETDAGILCQARNLETQVSARTRVLDYLWADCPLLMNDGDEWAQTIRQEGLGIVIEENRTDLWMKAILDLCRDREARAGMQANIARLKPQFHWSNCVEPLVQFLVRHRLANLPARRAA